MHLSLEHYSNYFEYVQYIAMLLPQSVNLIRTTTNGYRYRCITEGFAVYLQMCLLNVMEVCYKFRYAWLSMDRRSKLFTDV